MTLKKLLPALALIAVAALAAAGLLYYRGRTPAAEPSPTVLRPITVKLKWLHQAQFAGMYVAQEKGFYAREGLDAKLLPYSIQDPTIEAVADKKADFGVTGADELVLARAKGLPLKAIAVIYKINPVCAYSLKSRGITDPRQFIGKTVGLEKGINVEWLYSVMMGRLGIDRSKVKEVAIGYDATELLNGTTDVSTGYITNEPQLAVEKGQEVNTILMADYGANMYADVIFTRDDVLRDEPDLAVRFLRATLDGWQYTIEHTDEAVALTLKYATGGTAAHETYMLNRSIPLINTGDSPIGYMEPSQWENVQDILFDQKLLKEKIDVSQAYTLDILNRLKK